MKNYNFLTTISCCFVIVILFNLGDACSKRKTNIEKKDREMTEMLNAMKYNEYRDIENSQFGYLIDRLRASERSGKVVQFGEEEFDVYHYNDSTDTYPYRLNMLRYTLCINPKSVFPDHFTIMKTWDKGQEKYNQ